VVAAAGGLCRDDGGNAERATTGGDDGVRLGRGRP
jgi:hypothetical protein